MQWITNFEQLGRFGGADALEWAKKSLVLY